MFVLAVALVFVLVIVRVSVIVFVLVVLALVVVRCSLFFARFYARLLRPRPWAANIVKTTRARM